MSDNLYIVIRFLFTLAISVLLGGIVSAEPVLRTPKPKTISPTSNLPHVTVSPAHILPLVTADPNDPAWKNAAIIQSLTVSLGKEADGLKPLPTQVHLLWDADRLYLRFVCTATDLYSPFTHRDDPLYQGDVVELFLDVKGDARAWIELEVSPTNVVFDQLTVLTTEPHSQRNGMLASEIIDRDYWVNTGWTLENLRTAASVQSSDSRVTGWIVDMALPAKETLRRLGLEKYRAGMTFRANFLRYAHQTVTGTKERRFVPMNWAPVVFGCPHLSPQAMGFVTLAEK